MDRFTPAPATRPVAQVGRIIVHRYAVERRLNIPIILVYIYCVHISTFREAKWEFILEHGAGEQKVFVDERHYNEKMS